MAEIEGANRIAEASTRKILRITQQGFDTVELLLNITGQSIDASYSLIANAAFVAAETTLSISAALSTGSLGTLGLIQAGAGFAAAAGLFVQGIKILGKKDADLQQLRQITAFTNMWRLRS